MVYYFNLLSYVSYFNLLLGMICELKVIIITYVYKR